MTISLHDDRNLDMGLASRLYVCMLWHFQHLEIWCLLCVYRLLACDCQRCVCVCVYAHVLWRDVCVCVYARLHWDLLYFLCVANAFGLWGCSIYTDRKCENQDFQAEKNTRHLLIFSHFILLAINSHREVTYSESGIEYQSIINQSINPSIPSLCILFCSSVSVSLFSSPFLLHLQPELRPTEAAGMLLSGRLFRSCSWPWRWRLGMCPCFR